ncbi:acyl-CoA thioesterase [Ottowia thiooxydans]|uniref:acyl-CoA thioesterase n=1 Tax=Ottowia thiooxydans TaxID=219182 RepID=UPI00042801CE|nr:acyl-CoA thioesterase [Ottowia thiooxydans]
MKIEIPERKKLVFESRIPVRWGDMDAMRHLNNATYFRYMETARIDWFHTLGCVPATSQEGPVIVNAFCNFYRQFEYPDEVLIKMYVSDPRRTTFESWATMESVSEPGVIRAAGGATTIWVNFAQQKAVDLPESLRTLIGD